MSDNCIQTLERVEAVVSQFQDLMGKDAELLSREVGLGTAASMQQALDQIKESNRLLQIGIVGRVKAGKSSLLNALLFDGNSVLPKAATPMTAALTTLAYGESLSAEVDFFTDEDIRDIHAKAARYEADLAKLTKQYVGDLKCKESNPGIDEQELLKRADRRARRELQQHPVLCACYDQSCRIKKSGLCLDQLTPTATVDAGSFDELQAVLIDYVGADGKYMPFTKGVNVKLPLDVLKDISIVDTPGMNDPVESREERTRELLKYCDVILVVSPAGQFMSSEDLDLMDRVGSKEGVRELFVVASQIDTQLFGSEKTAYSGRLHDILDGITVKLDAHLKTSVAKLKSTSDEVGDTFDQLIEGGRSRVIHSSGISKTIFECKGNWDALDEGARHVWDNLTTAYPDYFSATDLSLSEENLKRLSNMDAVNGIITDVRQKKGVILEQKTLDYLEASQRLVDELQDKLICTSRAKVLKLQECDLEEITSKKGLISHLLGSVSATVDGAYTDLVDELRDRIRKVTRKEIDAVYRESKAGLEESENSETESYQSKKSGFCNWVAGLWGGGYETKTRTFTTVRSGAVRSAIADFTEKMESELESQVDDCLLAWKKALLKKVVDTLRSKVGDEHVDGDLILRAVRGVVAGIETPVLDYERKLPDNLRAKGKLTGSEADDYIENASDYLRKLKTTVNSKTRDYIADLVSDLNAVHISSDIFGHYQDELVELEKQLQSRELMLHEYARFEEGIRDV
jgi:tRNA U34 5-carboxymethylaminomethyl modifying GTPase MnmE/TrmE